MSPGYDLNINSDYNILIHSEVHIALSVTLSNAGLVNRHSTPDCHFQHMAFKVLLYTDSNINTSMT